MGDDDDVHVLGRDAVRGQLLLEMAAVPAIRLRVAADAAVHQHHVPGQAQQQALHRRDDLAVDVAAAERSVALRRGHAAEHVLDWHTAHAVDEQDAVHRAGRELRAHPGEHTHLVVELIQVGVRQGDLRP